MTRPDWDATWIAVARVVAQRSLCTRAQVGAVIVTADNRIVATGYNGPPAGFIHSGLPCTSWCVRGKCGPEPETLVSYQDCPALHAELNALSVCDRSIREGGTIYTTGHVCFNCAKAIANSGLATLYVESQDAGHRTPARSYEFLEECGITVIESTIP